MALRPSSSADSVLGLYELLDNILYYVYCPSEDDDDSSVYAYEHAELLLVNKLWFSVGVKYVWRCIGGISGPWRSDLEILNDNPDRLQIYARCIESIHIKNDRMRVEGQLRVSRSAEVELDLSQLKNMLQRVKFPRLQAVHLTGDSPVPFLNSLFQVYLRDTVKELYLYSLAPPAGFWSVLNVCDLSVPLFYLALSLFHLQLVCFYTRARRGPLLHRMQASYLRAETDQSPLYCFLTVDLGAMP